MNFDEFKKVSSKEWKQKIQYELDGEDYSNKFIWKSLEGVDVKPFYHHDDDKLKVSIDHRANSWKIGHSIYVNNEKNANSRAIKLIKKGVESVKFIINNPKISIPKLLSGININNTRIYISTAFLDSNFLKKFESKNFKAKNSIFILNDPIGILARNGNWYNNRFIDNKIISDSIINLNHLGGVISVDTGLYQNAGAGMAQQLAYGLAHANEYLNNFKNKINNSIVFKFSLSGNYFFEIAKLQAFRIIWDSLTKHHGNDINCHIVSSPSKRNKTIYDYNINILRTTTECMSGILGNSDTIMNLGYDEIYKKNNAFSERISINQLLILKHESKFLENINPTEGAYYIESITHKLANKALLIFKDIEKKGGFLKLLMNGMIQKNIRNQAELEKSYYKNSKKQLLGIHLNPSNKMKMNDELEFYPFLKSKKRKTLIRPILERRIAEDIEKTFLNNE